MDELETKEQQLKTHLEQLGSVLVCFSGGLDSGYLLAIATQVLGQQAIGMTATGPALAPSEREEARAFAKQIGARHELVDAHEIDNTAYVANEPDRCFHCKTSLYVTAKTMAERWGIAHIVNGTNLDDLGDYRPGLDAAKESGVVSPLLDAGFTKNDIRESAKKIGLSMWDKPAAACLASRIPYGTKVTPERLTQIAGFESELVKFGLRKVRVRHHETIARIEVNADDVARVASSPLREAIVEAGRRHGYLYITVDLAGYRVGSHNEVLGARRLPVV